METLTGKIPSMDSLNGIPEMPDVGNMASGAAGVAGSLMMGSFLPIIDKMMSILQMVLPLVILAAMAYGGLKLAQKFWHESKADEWMVVIRNGELVKCGVGLACWVMPGDQCIKFPSKINKVKFKASQVSSEMQGVDVSGMIIWSVHRSDDGPFKCYKSFGEDLKKSTPIMANEQLESMAISIIRDRIANLTLNEILKNRNKLKDGVKDEMQKVITGWGIWLETCEVQDVTIASRSLFTNLQTEFREKSRMEAEKISAEAENKINSEALVRSVEYNKLQTESDTSKLKLRNEQQLAIKKQQGALAIEEIKINLEKAEAESKKVQKQEQLEDQNKQARMKLQHDSKKLQVAQQVEMETEKQKLKAAELKTKQMELAEADAVNKQVIAHQKEMLKMKAECYTDNIMKSMILDTTKDVYKSLNIPEMKVINMGEGSKDPAGQLIAQMMTSYNTLSSSLKDK